MKRNSSDSNTVTNLEPISLPTEENKKPTNQESFCKKDKPDCNKTYQDIIYVTGQRRFWLLPENVIEHIQEAADTLRQQTIDTDKAKRMSKIAESGLMDYFLTPGPESFLEATDDNTGERDLYLHSKRSIEEEKAKQIQYRRDWEDAKVCGENNLAMMLERALFSSKQTVEANQKEVERLNRIAYARAEKLGYKRENGTFYTPRALEARDAVDNYIAERNKALDRGFDMFDPGSRKIASIWEHLKHYKELHKNFTQSGRVDERALRGIILNIDNLENLLSSYIKSILKLAECGIAVPEFSLSPDDQYEGTAEFTAYIKLLKTQKNLEQRIEQRYSEWVSATAGRAAPPGMIFKDLEEEWHKLSDQAESLKLQAELRTRELVPPRLFLWDPETYQPKPIERLAKDDIPLRELSCPSSSYVLNHISLKQLSKQGANLFREPLKDLRRIPKAVSQAADPDQIFSDWLKQEGALELDEKGPWFDENGIFQPEKFFSYLDSKKLKVRTLQVAERRKSWGDSLKSMVFEERTLRNIMLFDNSPQAQLLRLLMPEGTTLHNAVKLEGPKYGKSSLQLAKVEATLEVAAWRGEVDLFKLQLPKREEAKPIILKYLAYDGNIREVNFGKLSLQISAKAWGFAGASLVLAREVSLSQESGYTSISGLDTAKGTGEVASFNLFVGAQAGCKLSGELSWCPPLDAIPVAPIPKRVQIKGWQTLAKLEAEVAVSVGVTVKGNFGISLENGKLRLTIDSSFAFGAGIKGYLNFEVGYGSILSLLELIRKELVANDYKDLEWIEQDASSYVHKLCFFGSIGFDVVFLYARGYAHVKELYEIFTNGGRGGQIAYTLITSKQQDTIKNWILNLQPNALGPLLMALTSDPRPFLPPQEENEIKYENALLYQQQAIERCLNWISVKNNACKHFEESVIRMNRDGVKPLKHGQAYCENKLKLDLFMENLANPQSIKTRHKLIIDKYKKLTTYLGQHINSSCEYHTEYYGPAIAPAVRIKSYYKESNND